MIDRLSLVSLSLVRHPARKRSGSILTTPEPARGQSIRAVFQQRVTAVASASIGLYLGLLRLVLLTSLIYTLCRIVYLFIMYSYTKYNNHCVA